MAICILQLLLQLLHDLKQIYDARNWHAGGGQLHLARAPVGVPGEVAVAVDGGHVEHSGQPAGQPDALRAEVALPLWFELEDAPVRPLSTVEPLAPAALATLG